MVLAFVALVPLSVRASDSDAFARGTIMDTEGKPLKGAEVRLKRTDVKAEMVTGRSDAHGNYTVGVTPGVYTIYMRVGGVDEFAADNMTLQAREPLVLDYDMSKGLVKLSNARAKKPRIFVWKRAETGSHTSGRWVEVQEYDSREPRGQNLQQKNGMAVKHIQDMSGTVLSH